MSEIKTTRKYVRRDWAALIAQWHSSGASRSEFCAAAGVPLTGFYSALSRCKNMQSSSERAAGFAQVKFPFPIATDVVIELPRGVSISISGVDPIELVRRLSSEV